LANQALGYFKPELLERHCNTTPTCSGNDNENTDMSIKYEILWKFIGFGNIHQNAVSDLLNLFAGQKIGVGATI
jgi:hypothetical protein